jgi:hypothetical protein
MLSGTFWIDPISHRMKVALTGKKVVDWLVLKAEIREDELTKAASTAANSPRRNSTAAFGGRETRIERFVVPSRRAASMRIEKISPTAAKVELCEIALPVAADAILAVDDVAEGSV